MTEETKTEGAASAPVVSIIGGPAREKVVPLTFTYDVDGQTVESITVRRIRTNEAQGRTFEDLVKLMTGFSLQVIDSFDMDDSDAVAEAINGFLPRRLRMADERIHDSGESS